MKIAHIVDSMEMGGAEMMVSQMCRRQRELGHDPQVYAFATLGPLGENLREEGFCVKANIGSHLPGVAMQFYRIFKSERPDVVHLHNATPTIYAAIAARMSGVASIISTRHGLVGAPYVLRREVKYSIAVSCCDWIVGICDATVANLKKLHRVHNRKMVRVYNGAVPVRRVEQQCLPIKQGFTLVCVGRLAPVKNHALIFRALRQALEVIPSLHLWIVGDGDQRSSLERLARELQIWENVTFWGQQQDVAPFFSAADAFIMTSTSEGLPIALLQAFSAGLPVVVTAVGGMGEVVEMAQAGYTVELADASEMVAAILRLFDGESARKEFSRRAQNAFGSHFTLEKMVEDYMNLYQNSPRMRRKR
jgi:glycosyltransferase involved in cell wall biosynthesis